LRFALNMQIEDSGVKDAGLRLARQAGRCFGKASECPLASVFQNSSGIRATNQPCGSWFLVLDFVWLV
jgi:hypothetical protein